MCDFTRSCVAETGRHLYCGKRCRCNLAACLLFARMHTNTNRYIYIYIYVCDINREAMVSACIHTQACCRNKESVVTLPVALVLF